ncbi:MAG: FMN-binding protein [Firmicutes bacterium]|nr:FMN-binding protein [Bacillota bacterium]
MREILKLSITLTIVGLVSAALLTGVNNITAPIIADRQEAEYREALELYFPEVVSFENQRLEDDYFDLIFDSSDRLIGVMATIEQQGYDGTITYNLALDGEGKVVGMLIISHTETPGIGDVITTADFQEQFIGKSLKDPLLPGEDVDIVTGATISTSAMITSIRRVVSVVAESFLGHETGAVDITAVPDGIYQGSAPGLSGPILVEVEVSGGVVTRIDVLDHDETPTYFIESYPLIPELIIAEQSFDVDTKTGATLSAKGIVEAVQAALAAALEANGGGE